jgi:hypothetical protein
MLCGDISLLMSVDVGVDVNIVLVADIDSDGLSKAASGILSMFMSPFAISSGCFVAR